MKKILTIFLFAFSIPLMAQTVVFDRNHFLIINENAAIRNVSEIGYQESLAAIRQNTDDISVNMTGLAMVQTMILGSLTEVKAFKDDIRLKQIGRAIQRIYALSNESIDIASQNRVLLIFAETYIQQAKERSLSLVAEVSGFILEEGNNILINANVRDELLGKIYGELQLIQGYMSAVKNSIYWASMNGLLHRLNPFQAHINRDLDLVNQILIKKKTVLK